MNNAGLGTKDRAMEIMPVIPAFSLAKAYTSQHSCTLNHVSNVRISVSEHLYTGLARSRLLGLSLMPLHVNIFWSRIRVKPSLMVCCFNYQAVEFMPRWMYRFFIIAFKGTY